MAITLNNVPTTSFGERLKQARAEAGMFATDASKKLNAHFEESGVTAVNIDTFRSWEKIGTPAETAKGRSYPHPIAYPYLCRLYGVSEQWLLCGEMGGRISKSRGTGTGVMAVSLAHERLERLFRELLQASPRNQQILIENVLLLLLK